jgi:hypothetical protein
MRSSWSGPGSKSSAGKTRGNGSTGHGNRYRARGLGEARVGTPVYLDLRVKVVKEWQRRPRASSTGLAADWSDRHGFGEESLGSNPRPTSWALNRSMLSIAVIA